MAVARSRRRSRIMLIARRRAARVQLERHAPAYDVEPGSAIEIEPDGETLIVIPGRLSPTTRIAVTDGEPIPTVPSGLVAALRPDEALHVELHGLSVIDADQLEPLLEQAARDDRHLVIELLGDGQG